MRFRHHIYLILALPLLFSACTLFKRSVSRPVKVAFDRSQVRTQLSSSAWNPKYTVLTSEEQVLEAFLKGFNAEAGYTKNVTLTENEAEADYVLRLTELSVSESSRTEKVDDPKSEYNGQEFVLNSVECSVKLELHCRKLSKPFPCFNSKSRSEKLKNNRNAADLVFGTNKDRTNYRTRLLSDYVCNSISEDVGHRIWVPVTRKIAKTL